MAHKYFIDFEFSEGFRKPISWLPGLAKGNKPRWFIELISIGITDDYGREYFAVNEDYNANHCNDWVKGNVIPKLPPRNLYDVAGAPFYRPRGEFKEYFPPYGYGYQNPVYKSIEEIRHDIIKFVTHIDYNDIKSKAIDHFDMAKYITENPIEFWGYFSDYDWVLFCTIFGTMMDLPSGFPMYCRDLKQWFDVLVEEIAQHELGVSSLLREVYNDDEKVRFNQKIKDISTQLKTMENYPQQQDEHSAIADAKWNKNLHAFLKIIQQSI